MPCFRRPLQVRGFSVSAALRMPYSRPFNGEGFLTSGFPCAKVRGFSHRSLLSILPPSSHHPTHVSHQLTAHLAGCNLQVRGFSCDHTLQSSTPSSQTRTHTHTGSSSSCLAQKSGILLSPSPPTDVFHIAKRKARLASPASAVAAAAAAAAVAADATKSCHPMHACFCSQAASPAFTSRLSRFCRQRHRILPPDACMLLLTTRLSRFHKPPLPLLPPSLPPPMLTPPNPATPCMLLLTSRLSHI